MKQLEVWVIHGCPQASLLWDRVALDMESKVTRYQIWRATLSQEICPKTVQEKRKVKVHIHLVSEWPKKVRAGRFSDWELAGVKPTNARSDDNADEGDLVRKRQRKVSSDGAHFYNQMQKIGACNVWTNYKAFEDFNVNPRWISVWMQRQKISSYCRGALHQGRHKRSP